MVRRIVLMALTLGLVTAARGVRGETALATKAPAAAAPTAKPAMVWLDDYAEGMRTAKAEKKMLLIHFYNPAAKAKLAEQEAQLFSDKRVQAQLGRYLLLHLPTTSQIQSGGKSVRLLNSSAFSELRGQAGIAMVDYANAKTEHYGMVVSEIPFSLGKYFQFSTRQMPVLLALPAGSLTQRSMIFAVRIPPEAPASTRGEKSGVLLQEAESHSYYQASIGVQGHQQWDSRFQRILGRLRNRSAPVEVVAESWPNEGLMDSCVDCVASWRQSPGHWSAVSGQQASYGYDIRQGGNGIWYATGIFAN